MTQRFPTNAAALLAVLLAGACVDEPPAVLGRRLFVGQKIDFAATQGQGISIGFNLDGRISNDSDVDTCGQPDYVSPDGEPGIDNQFGIIWTALLDVAGDAVEGLIAGSIADGTLLMMLELDGVGDFADSECVSARIFMGSGTPDIGTDGLITSGQTFDAAVETPITNVPCQRMVDGRVVLGPFDGVLPIKVLDVRFDLPVYGAIMDAGLREDGSMEVMVGAGIDGAILRQIGGRTGDPNLESLLDVLVGNVSDLARDDNGTCQRLSATIVIDAVPAFLYPDVDL